MRIILALILAMFTIGLPAQEQRAATQHMVPENIEQSSIKMIRFSSTLFAVSFSYTEAGAKKVLTSWEADPKHPAMSEEWKTGWLKRRTDKCFFSRESAAAEFMKSIKNK